MAYHNETCGCAECGNYGQIYNPGAIHNQSCGCAECGNYPQASRARSKAAPPVLSPASPQPDVPPAVRILPMNAEEFPGQTAEEVQSQFFLGQLPSPSRRGRYNYRMSGLHAESGTMVLFQFDNRIIASAVFTRRERFAQPEGVYHGALYFDPDTIRVFDPVSADVVREVWQEEFGGFSNAKWSLSAENYRTFERRLTGIEIPHSAHES